jgi:hypothetical protein
MKNDVFWDLTLVALVRIDVSEELCASFVKVTRIGQPILVTMTSQKTPFFKYFTILKLKTSSSIRG